MAKFVNKTDITVIDGYPTYRNDIVVIHDVDVAYRRFNELNADVDKALYVKQQPDGEVFPNLCGFKPGPEKEPVGKWKAPEAEAVIEKLLDEAQEAQAAVEAIQYAQRLNGIAEHYRPLYEWCAKERVAVSTEDYYGAVFHPDFFTLEAGDIDQAIRGIFEQRMRMEDAEAWFASGNPRF